jgi:hypothetical protein
MKELHFKKNRNEILSMTLLILLYMMIFVSACSNNDEFEITNDNTFNGKFIIVDTDQIIYYNNEVSISEPSPGESFYGQDATYSGNQPNYVDNGNGTITDLNTGLMWQQSVGEKMSLEDAISGAESFNLAGFNEWRLPTIKELYSLIIFSGDDVSGWTNVETANPFIDTDYFKFEYGDESIGERLIDAQYASCTKYVGTTMDGDETVFGVNFADGRIKGYPVLMNGSDKLFFVKYVRGNVNYGINNFVDNNNGTISDLNTELMWLQDDSGTFEAGSNNDGSMTWEEALEWVENFVYAGYSDWRLPNAKELQSIVDYTRSPSTSDSPAIDPVFSCTEIIDEGDEANYPFYWTGTTHSGGDGIGSGAVYIAFGEALGFMQSPTGGDYTLMDVHGAGAQRSDPKIGTPEDYPYGHGPQGDVIRIYNYVRLVRDI